MTPKPNVSSEGEKEKLEYLGYKGLITKMGNYCLVHIFDDDKSKEKPLAEFIYKDGMDAAVAETHRMIQNLAEKRKKPSKGEGEYGASGSEMVSDPGTGFTS